MEINRVSATVADVGRLDAEYYKLAFRQAAAAVRRLGSTTNLEALRSDSHPIRRGIDMPRVSSDPAAPRLVTIASFTDPGIDFTDLDGIDPAQHAEFRASQLSAGDLVVAMGGHVGRAAICPPDPPMANIGRHSARIVVDPKKADAHFLWAFLTSRFGELQLRRQVTGSVQAGVNLEDLRLVDIPGPNPLVQRYIGHKVRQAERLRERARNLTQTAEHLVEALLERRLSDSELIDAYEGRVSAPALVSRIDSRRLSDSPNSRGERARGTKLSSRVTPRILKPSRLDSSYYAPHFLENEAFLSSCGIKMVPIETLTDKCNCGFTPVDVQYDGSGTGLIRTTDVRPNAFLGEGVLRTSELRVARDSSVAAIAGDLVYTMSGTIGYAAVIPPTDEIFGFSNTIVRARFSERTGQDPWFTAVFFNSKYGYTQSLRLVSGGIQGHVMPNPFKGLLVPTPDSRAQRYVGDLLRLSEACAAGARALVTAAKLLAEMLVDRRILEAELAAVQQALDSNDKSPERAVLRTLRQGDAPNAPALFVDLESLYALIEGCDGSRGES
jgi:type I restriction enzyme, S subunit